MNLSHRMGEGKGLGKISGVLHKIEYPVNIIIPLVLILFGWYEIRNYLGQEWQIGSFSTPLIPKVAEIISGLFNTTIEVVLSDLVIWGIVFGSGTLYLFVKSITDRHLPAIISGLLVNLPIVIFSTTHSDRHLLALSQNDGAHILSLSIIPLAWLVFMSYSRQDKKYLLAIFLLLTLILVLISFFSLFTLFMGVTFIAISEAFVSHARSKLARYMYCVLGIIIIITLIYNATVFSMISTPEGQAALVSLLNLLPLSFFIFPVLGTFAFLVFDRRPRLQPLFISASLTVFFGLLHLVRMNLVDIALSDEGRFGAELTLALSFLWGMFVLWFFELLRSGKFMNKNPLVDKFHLELSYGFILLVFVVILGTYLFIPRNLL